MIRALSSLALTTLVVGCSTFEKPLEETQFVCDDGRTLLVSFDYDIARITRDDGKAFVLPRVPSSEEFAYSTGRLDLRGNAREAVWTQDVLRPATCRSRE